MQQGFPPAMPGQSVGLLGGSFDPPHDGHALITRRALAALGLDRVWWMVSPGNPLKPDAPAALHRRMEAAKALMRHPKVTVTDVEARLGTRFTADTLRRLTARYPGVRFVWLMGADNLATLHLWEHWRDIVEQVPMGILARPGEQLRAGLSPAARTYANWRLPAHAARGLPWAEAPAWVLLSGPMVETSSSALRREGAWTR